MFEFLKNNHLHLKKSEQLFNSLRDITDEYHDRNIVLEKLSTVCLTRMIVNTFRLRKG